MQDMDLTEAAARALSAAAGLAVGRHSDQIEPGDLLWALVAEESRAAEILVEGGLTTADLESLGPRPVKFEGDHPEASRSADVEVAVLEAARQAGVTSRGGQVGTEHLLWGLAEVSAPLGELLAARGLAPEELGLAVDNASGTSTAPLAVDVALVLPSPRSHAVDIHRVLDAAANRAREALRVVEDLARFSLDDVHLAGLLKQLRHDLVTTLRKEGADAWLAARDTPGDVGTTLSTPTETTRGDIGEVLSANLARAAEAFRTLEEFSKLLTGRPAGEPASAVFEQMRYRLYTLHKATANTLVAGRRLAGCRLCVLVTEAGCRDGPGPAVRDTLAAGADLVQLREPDMPDRELIALARRMRRWTRDAGGLLIINDRPDLARLADADGVHVGQDDLGVADARRVLGPNRLVGVSTHTIDQARQAVLDGADYLGVGPVFASTTKTFDHLAGLDFVRQVTEEISLPWFAIGGISSENIEEVLAAGATRVAVSRAICAAGNPGTATASLATALAAG